MAVFLILVIIFRRQGLLGNSEILLDSWFSKDTYLSLFRKQEYKDLGIAAKNCVASIGKLFKRKK